jgi:hypothetical protein
MDENLIWFKISVNQIQLIENKKILALDVLR